MRVEKLLPEDWAKLSEDAHKLAFETIKPVQSERIDYALVCVEGTQLKGYLTAKEMDSETVYWQFGGAFPGTKGTHYTFKGYLAFVRWTKEHYKRIQTRIENTNTAMLHFAMKAGFVVVGVRYVQGSTLLELELEFK